jgi:eukaryotic-like serine/threonine-protein kinase
MSNNCKQLYEFGPFRLDPEKRILLRDDKPVALQMKTFETLLALVRNSQQVVLKEDLLKMVWPHTFVEESNLTQNIFVLRKTLGNGAGERRYIATIPGRGYQFLEKVRTVPEEEVLVAGRVRSRVAGEENPVSQARLPAGHPGVANRWKWGIAGLIASALATIFGTLYLPHKPKINDKDTIMLAEFVNTTGDSVFDGALRQGLASEMEQSPFFNLLSDRRIAQTLTLMTKPKSTSLTSDIAREVCQRSNSTALIEGTISQVGTRYLLTLKATNCASGDLLASSSHQVGDKSHILDALGKSASDMREKLGEASATRRKYDVPLQNVTTASLEALQAYSLGQHALYALHDGFKAASFYQRAIDLDPNFAMAYARLGVADFNSGELTRASENIERSYALRDRVSELEKLFIEAHHADIVTGELEQARKIYELWSQMYPRDSTPLNSLGVICGWLGYYDQSLRAYQAALELDSFDKTVNSNLVITLIRLGRLEQAKTTATNLLVHYPDDPVVHGLLYDIHFLEHDIAAMRQDVAWHTGRAGWEDSVLHREAKTAAYNGHLAQSLDFVRQAVHSAETADRTEVAALYEAEEGVEQALVGNSVRARKLTREALGLAKNNDVEATAALALALDNETSISIQLVSEVARQSLKYAPMQLGVLAEIRAAAALPHAPQKAVEILTAAIPYEFGGDPKLYPAYFRGYAYIAMKNGPAAVQEFQKVIDHPGIMVNDIVASLAHLGLARAYIAAGEPKEAKSEYENFLALWKDADPDIPILKQAKAEYAKLQ